MTRRTIPWHRLLPRHHRLLVWWALAGLGIALPWLLAGDSALTAWLRQPTSGPELACQLQSVTDGDTVRARCNGEALKIRLHCIDAPELSQRPWGQESRAALRRLLPPRFSIRVQDTDRYGRKVATLIDPRDLTEINLAMVQQGQAAVYRRYCSDARYRRAEAAAKAAGLGIWRTPGDQQRPWDYRRR
jgi:endonuclease YncB( thermonuclease family)